MPSKRKKSKAKQPKSKKTTAKLAKKQLRAKAAKRLKKPAPKKHAKKKAAKTRLGRNQKIETIDEYGLQLDQRRSKVASGRQSGDLQGLSRSEQANSESVDELAEEGNLFEAGAVAGVEHADDADEREVHTHEVPEDDVPDEYLDKE
jgi:N utilization substance protein A